MPLITNTDTSPSWNHYANDSGGEERDAALLDRYLAIVETNKKASEFVPDDALLALDMAEFASGQLRNPLARSQVSVARLAMALIKPQGQTNLQ